MTNQSDRKLVWECAEWLAYCLNAGWKKEQLDDLEALWWKYHKEENHEKPE